MNEYEKQLRATLEAMQAPATLAQRTAQADTLAVLLMPDNVAMLLDVLTDERREALGVLNSVVELTSPDSPVWAPAVALAQRVFQLLRPEEPDETEDSHGGGPAPMTPPLPPIPSGIVFRETTAPSGKAISSFYMRGTDKNMGYDFYHRWHDRHEEFPNA